jgi:Fe-S-cluster containining protein
MKEHIVDIDFTQFFKKYEAVVAMADIAFNKVKDSNPECVKCKINCSDCCYALFDLTLIEAVYINHKTRENFAGEKRVKLEEKANIADRAVFKLKKNAYNKLKSGKSEDEIINDLAAKRIRCPLLNESDCCALYEFRPITCRLYGIPVSIGGAGHTCGLSGFKEGKNYQTVNMDAIQKKLYEISDELVRHINSKYLKLSEVLVPLSMAILNVYDKEYLGLAEADKTPAKEK